MSTILSAVAALLIIAVSAWAIVITIREEAPHIRRTLGISPAAPKEPQSPSPVASERDGANRSEVA